MSSLTPTDILELEDEYSTPEERERFHSLLVEHDPLIRLLDPAFTEVSWEYSASRTGADIPGNLHPKQVEVLNSPAKHRWLFWGNQVGKTTLGAVDLVLLCLGRHPNQKWEPPVVCWASALTWELWEKILLPELLTWIPPDRVIDAPTPHKQSTKRDILIRADNGAISRITGKAAQQGREIYQSATIHAAWLDEEHPEDVWDEIQPRLVRHNGRTISTMTPLKGLTWVFHRYYEPRKEGKLSSDLHFVSHAGLKDNPSITPKAIEEITGELKHNPSMLAARLHGHFVRPSGLVFNFDPDKHFENITPGHVRAWLQNGGKAYAACDFGLWRFAFGLAVSNADGELKLIEEVFSQRETLEQRARKIHDVMMKNGIPDGTLIWGDCANPQDILELNLAFQRMGSPYHVNAVYSHLKIIRTGIERTENLLSRRALTVRRGIGDGQSWHLGRNAGSDGKPMLGSRFLWEINNWMYPQSERGDAQKDKPDDDSADGADMMDMLRYLVMAYWEEKKPQEQRVERHEDMHPGFEMRDGQVTLRERRRYDPSDDYHIPQYRIPVWGDD